MTDPTPGTPAEIRELADVIARLRRAMRRTARAGGDHERLSVAQLELLAAVAERPDARPGELAQVLRLAPNSVTTLTHGLVATGLITRRGDAHDRRAIRLLLTPTGARALDSWRSVNEAALTTAMDALPDRERAAVIGALPALTRLVEQIPESTRAQDRDRGAPPDPVLGPAPT
ncbi:MAG: MarR family winged helix-turn-helix transcriptional regulator [Actinomycetes bacterium]